MKKGLLLLFVLLSAMGLRAQDATVVGDTLKADVTTVLENGKTYILGEQYAQCKVSFTAPADGFLSITPSQKVSNTKFQINGASSTFTKTNGGIEKKGMAAGSVFTGTFYAPGTPSADNTYALVVTFEEGKPYEDLSMTEALPADGGEWSGAAVYYTTMATYMGQAYYNFSSAVNTADVVASITIGEKTYSPITLYPAKNGFTLQSMPDTLGVAVAAGLIKAGDTFTVTLSGIKDKEFAANTLADQTFTYTLASTACTGINPAASTSRTVLPEEVVFSFDGNVKIDNAKFYFVDKKSGEKTELTGAVDGMDLTVTVPAIEGLLPKLYDIVAEGVTDENGKVITYGETEGQLTAAYGTSNGYFKPTMEPANYANVSSLKTYTATLPGAVVYDASLVKEPEITFTKLNEASYSFDAVEGVAVSYEIKENVITFTLSEEITAPGDYRLSVPAKLFWSKELYDAENLSDKTCYYLPSQNITCTILPYGPTTVTPENNSMQNKLGVITLSFDEVVEYDDAAKVAVLKQVEIEDELGWPSVSIDTIAKVSMEYDFENDKNILVNLGNIDSAGTYVVVIPEGSIWADANENKKIGEWTYTYNVDPDYWDPEWVVKVSGTSQESPVEVIAGRKYEFSDMNTYITYTATENGRLYFTKLDEHYVDLSRCDETWYNNGDLAKNAEGQSWTGVEAGQTAYITDYMLGGTRQYLVTFEAGDPYEKLEFTGTFPAAGGQYSASVEAPESYENGAVEFYFSTKVDAEDLGVFVVIPSLDNKEIDLSEDAQIVQGNITWGEAPAYVAVVLGDLIDEIKSSNGLKAGDKIQVVLKNVHDINFESNKLAENPMVELALAATVCTSVYPNTEYSVEEMPTELSLRFDGNVTCTNGKGRIIDVKSGHVQEFAIENFECKYVEAWTTYYEGVVTLPALEKEFTGKQFRIEIEGLVDEEGNAISYGEEIGKFVLDYRFSDAAFNYVTADPEDGSELESIKTTKLTFGDEVHIGPDASAYFYYGEDEEVKGEFTVDPADSKSVIITWSKEITKPGRYNINIDEGSIYDSGYDETKEDLGLADGAYYNPGIYLEYLIPADLSATTVTSISPEPYSFFGGAIEKLPAEAVIEFEGNVKEIASVYGQASVGGGWSVDAALPEGATVLAYKLEGNKLIVTLPADEVASMSYGSYVITVNAIGEDGKPIGYALDSWGDLNQFADYISFSYQVQKLLKVTETVPADYSTVKELSTVTLTFSEELEEYDSWSDAPCLLNANDDSKVADFTYAISGNQLTLTLAEPVTAAGSYAVYIPDWAVGSVSGLYNDAEIYVFVDVDPNYVAQENLAIVSATPENGATVSNLTTVELKLNKEVGYLYPLMLIPSDGGDDAAQASLVKSETDPATYTLDFTIGGFLADGATLRKGVTYTMTLEAYASEEAANNGDACETVTLTYVGDAEAFQYSNVTFESITPAEGFVITDKSQNKFTVKFSGAVEMVEDLTFINMGQGATEKFASIEANADKTEYTLTIAESLLATLRNEVYIIFAANDLEGKRVQGNNGEEEYSCFAISFKTVIGVPDLTVTPDAAIEQASLNTISIKCADGLIPSWTAGNITLTDANGKVVELNDPEAVVAEGADEWATPTEWTVALKEELKTVGAYTLTIPAGYFNIGNTQGQVMGSKETVVVFNITEKAQGINAVTVDAEVVVYNIAGVAVAQGKASEVLKNLGKGIYIVNGKKYVVK
mgnify:CR=1 FL=1